MPTYDFLPTRNVFGMDASQDTSGLMGSLTNPRTGTKEQIIAVYRQACEGESASFPLISFSPFSNTPGPRGVHRPAGLQVSDTGFDPK